MKNCGDGGAGGSRAGCRGLRPLPGFGAAPQNLCRSTTSQALRAAKGRKKRGSFHPHRFPPSAPTTRFAALANIGVLRAGRAQPLYLLTPAGRFALRATAHRADASLRCPKTCAAAQPRKRCERPKAARKAACYTRIVFPHPPPPLVSLPSQISAFCALPRAALVFAHAFGSLCHLRWQVPTGHALPVLPAQSSRRALAAPTARFAVHLRVALRCAQQPIGLTLPSGAPKPVPQHNPASVASGQRPQETRLAPPASFLHQPSGAAGASSPLRPIFLLRFGRVSPPARRNQQSNPTSKGANPHDHH